MVNEAGPIRIGIIGTGKIAQRHILAYRSLRDVDITVWDINPLAAGKTAQDHGVAIAESFEAYLDDPGFDAVDICVPTAYHADFAIRALAAGKDVFCEKPLCVTVKEALRVREAAEAAGRMVMVGYLYRHHPAFQFTKKILDDGVIGNPHFAVFRLGGRGDAAAWKHLQGSAGGAMLEMMVHKVDLALWLLGDFDGARTLIAETLLPTRTIQGETVEATAEDCVLLELRREGLMALCESDLVTAGYMNYVEIVGDQGSIFTSILEFLPTVLHCKQAWGGVYSQGHNFFHFPIVNLFELELGQFVDAVRAGTRSLASLDDSVCVASILEAAARETVKSPG